MFKGNLADLPLLNVLQMFRGGSRSGILRITHPFGGIVGIELGRIIHAAVGPSRGERALAVLAALQSAPYELDPAPPVERSIERSSDAVLADLAREMLAWEDLRPRLGDWNLVAQFNPNWSARPDAAVSNDEWGVLSQVDGQKTIGTLIQSAPASPTRVAQILIRFREESALTFESRFKAEPVELMVLPIYSPDERTIFVDQALFGLWSQVLPLVQAELQTSKGAKNLFRVEGRKNIEGRVQIADNALKKLKVARGEKVRLLPVKNQTMSG
jgi:hypothetical protein